MFELPISPPVKLIVAELPIAPIMKHVMFELKGLLKQHKKRQKDMETSVPQTKSTPPPPCLSDYFPPPQGCQRAQNWFDSPPPQGCQRAQNVFHSPPPQGFQRAKDFLDSPPPQGFQRAQNGVNPYSVKAGAPISKYSGYPGTTTKAGPGISDTALAHMLRPLSPMCVPEDDGEWDSGWDHMSTPGTSTCVDSSPGHFKAF
ncbi:uncharacterized protein LOC123481100 [Coregonus clupeaformis]|nr:uncharacterized protein LOC123481100 [Coregonus clupeaformis]